ncbi:MAG: hypothetical protein ACE5FD_12060, partial [Anaerolineae bacterium]
LMGMVNGRFPGAAFAFDVLTNNFNPRARAIFAASDAPMQWFVPADMDFSTLGLATESRQVVTHHFTARWQSLGFHPNKLRQNQGNILIASQFSDTNANLS